ncbi:MAG: hypothetical protein IJ637_06295 [Prevotella sp.]|nr:hypothetical protein [Prevotella sp.]
MKKNIYIAPNIKIVKTRTAGMIAASQTLRGVSEYTAGGTLSGARSFDMFDDDDEE